MYCSYNVAFFDYPTLLAFLYIMLIIIIELINEVQ